MPNCEYLFNESTYSGYKEAIVIGNGPSGLCTSYMLAGNWPYWNKNRVFDEYLQMRLESQCSRGGSLIEQDLEMLSDGLEGRSQNPIALLFDNLNNPGSDLGYEIDSCLEWKYDASKEIDHLVIGKTPPGGAWNLFDGDQLTISLSKWMELPDLKFNDFKNKSKCTVISEQRATANDVRDYYQFYVKKKNLEKYLLNNATVTNIRKIVPIFSFNNCNGNNEFWEVCGIVENGEEKFEFNFICKHLILAVGAAGLHNELHVKGENYNFILHTIHDLEAKIKTHLCYLRKYPLVIVGAGLSAADCILLALKYHIKIVHIIRRSVYDKNIVYPKLPKILYPEYHSIYEKMLEYKEKQQHAAAGNDNYVLYDQHRIKAFKANHKCIITTVNTVDVNEKMNDDNIFDVDDENDSCYDEYSKEIKFSFACVLIGHKINLGFIPEQISNNLACNVNKEINTKDNPISVNPFTYETTNFKNLYAIGPLAGDNFVRFGIAGALGITNNLWKTRGQEDL